MRVVMFSGAEDQERCDQAGNPAYEGQKVYCGLPEGDMGSEVLEGDGVKVDGGGDAGDGDDLSGGGFDGDDGFGGEGFKGVCVERSGLLDVFFDAGLAGSIGV